RWRPGEAATHPDVERARPSGRGHPQPAVGGHGGAPRVEAQERAVAEVRHGAFEEVRTGPIAQASGCAGPEERLGLLPILQTPIVQAEEDGPGRPAREDPGRSLP